MKKLLLLTTIIIAGHEVHAQAVATKTGLRLYEHHSASISGPKGANGSQSGYDFVTRAYVNSFDTTSFGPHMDGTDTTIDMVEHNGQYGNGGQFGFTSGVSSIWMGDIKGNAKTMWMEAPASFNYAGTTDVNQIKTAFNPAQATQAIAAVKNGVYLGRIRNSNLYVAVLCSNVTNKVSGNTFFDFEYKYGVWNPNTTTVPEVNGTEAVSIYPNPATGSVTIGNVLQQQLSVKVLSLTGQQVHAFTLDAQSLKAVAMDAVAAGLYLVAATDEDGRVFTQKLVKQ